MAQMSTAQQIASDVRSERTTAAEQVRAALERISRTDAKVGAFRTTTDEAALAAAARIDADPALRALPLAGVPIAVKDNLPVAGEAMLLGSRATSTRLSAADHEVVRRLKAAGAIVVGLTNVPELCVWPMTDGDAGISRNPWALDRTPGGSSGGSAAAVAAGMVPIAVGNDGLGSIRIPAACCGLVGVKPGSGVVPGEFGNADWFGMSVNGPLATTVPDAALMLSVMAGRPDLASVAPLPRGVTVARSTHVPVPGISAGDDQIGAVSLVAEILRQAQCSVSDLDPPYTQRMVTAATMRWYAGVAASARGLPTDRLQPRTRAHIRLGKAARPLVRPADVRTWQEQAAQFFSGVDLLVTPILTSDPIQARQWSEQSWRSNVLAALKFAPFPAPWNLAGYPAIAVPAGMSAAGLPLSVQVVAAPGREALLLSVAAAVEAALPWPRIAPGFGES
jgi:amidase